MRGESTGEVTFGVAVLAGIANVIMQLAMPGVGHGVVESRVESGRFFDHPVKRGRTTLAYLAVAMMGTERERALFARGVDRVHRQVYSTAESPVAYRAFDPVLQLWVAACLYQGMADIHQMVFGRQPSEQLYREAAVLATTLQVPEEDWPADRAAFERYWADNLRRISIDDTVRAYLTDLVMLTWLPWPLSRILGNTGRFITTGFLPDEFRAQLRLSWSARQQRRFQRLRTVLGAVVRYSPPVLRCFPFNLVLWDVRRRIRTGRPLV